MEILSLKLLVTEDAVNRLLTEQLPKNVPVQKLQIRITPEGIRIQGEYPTVFMNVAFETLWTIAISGRQLELQLDDIRVSGLPATMLRGMIFKVIEESITNEPGLSIDRETLRIDLDQFLASKGMPLKINLRGVLCSVGSMIIEAGN